MTFNAGTATDHLDLLGQLIECMTGRHMATAVINAGGTGHAVGDVLTIDNTGATQTETAQIEVTSVSGGVIDGIRIFRGGIYTVDPTTTTGNAQSATTGSGINFTADLTFDDTGWTLNTRQSRAVSAAPTVAAGGTGYSVSDVLTAVGGVQTAQGGSPATYTVATLSGSAVATVTTTTQGDYEVFPTNAVLTSVSPAGGTGCTLTLTPEDVPGETIVVLSGDAGAAIDPIVGIKTYSSETDETSVNTVFNWALFGMTAWGSSLELHNQPNISPGFNVIDDGTITASASGDGAFVPLKDSDAFDMDWWFSVTGRRVVGVVRIEGPSTVYYAHFSFGLLNQFGITTEFPFPAFVAGTSDRKRVWWRDTGSIFGGLTEVIRRANGPQFVWTPEGSWLEAKNASIGSNTTTTPAYSTENTAPRVNVWPLGPSNIHQFADDATWQIAATLGFDMDDFTLLASPIAIYRTPDTGGDLFPLFPNTIVQADSASNFFRTFGEMDGVWWLHVADASISSEDRITQGGVAYTIFQNGTRIQDWSFFAMRED